MKAKILALILASPNIRTVEISDKLDIEVASIRPLIAAELASGDILVEPIKAPNGLVVHSFRFAITPPKTAEPERAPIAAPKARTVAPAEDRLSKTELAIAYLREHSTPDAPVQTAFLSRAMGLGVKAHPSSYLVGAIRDGRVVFSQKAWCLGPDESGNITVVAAEPPAPTVAAIAQVAEKAPEAVAVVIPAPKVGQEPALTPALHPVETPAARPESANESTLGPTAGMPILLGSSVGSSRVGFAQDDDRFVAGLMSNGELHIMSGGKMMALPENHSRELWDYMRKMGYAQWPTC